MTQTRVESRRTGMPEQPGPVGVVGDRAHGHAGVGAQEEPAQGTRTTGTTMAISRSLPLKSTGKMRTWCGVSGVVTPPTIEGPPSQPGTSSWIPPKSWARPMVTTMTMRRGAVKKRQRMTASTSEAEGGADEEGDPDADEPVDVVGQVELDRHRGGQRRPWRRRRS